jgi:hypothetical protein
MIGAGFLSFPIQIRVILVDPVVKVLPLNLDEDV